LLAGVLIGPHTPGFDGDVHVARQLAEVGVILLMFGVGLHFHIKDLLSVWKVAVPGAIGQSVVTTVLAMGVFALFDVPLRTGGVVGMAMAVASTVVLMRVLIDADALDSPEGHVAVGWLLVEDIFTVILLVLVPILAGGLGSSEAAGVTAPQAGLAVWQAVGFALLKLGALVAIVMIAGSRIIPWILVRVARLRSRELFTLTVLVFSVAIAAGSYFIFGASMALGAFLAGMVVAQSPVSHQAAADALPMRDAFAVLFFVSVGMLVDPMFLVQHPLIVAAALAIILIAKPAAALAIVALLGHSPRTALTVAIGLAQIGEFSFILSELARRHGLMSDAGYSLLVASAIISITLNPLLFRSLPKLESWLKSRPRLWKLLNSRAERHAVAANAAASQSIPPGDDGAQGLAIVVGYGPVGRSVHRLLRDASLTTVVVDRNMDTISTLTDGGQIAIFGDASQESILEQAGVRRASHLVLTLPNSSERAAIVAVARNLNPHVRILVRARYLREREDLEQAGATAAVFEEAEAAVALARLVLADTGLHREAAYDKINDLRFQLIMESVSSIRSQRVASVMVPWARVRWLAASADRNAVLAQVAKDRYSRWPVVEVQSGRAIGYLLAKDLISSESDPDWRRHIRPLKTIHPGDKIESILTEMQSESAMMCVVEDKERLVGLITLEDILEQVFGRFEDEYKHEAEVSLATAVANGGIVLHVTATTREQAIRELAASIPKRRLPDAIDESTITELALAREQEFSTDLGNGVAVPHARCPNLTAPLIVFGRCREGLLFSHAAAELVRLIFLVVTPEEHPELQLSLLAQLAKALDSNSLRNALLQAEFPVDVMEALNDQATAAARAPAVAQNMT
jgi:CPA2 family monovalent cation:H+ antiporter-2